MDTMNYSMCSMIVMKKNKSISYETFANFRLDNRILRNSIVIAYLKNYRETATSHKIR